MTLLLDTCTFLWLLTDPTRLSPVAAAALADPANRLVLSAASVWEIAVKYGQGKLPLPAPPDRFIPGGRAAHRIDPLPLEESAALYARNLPLIHKDPFDRLLICQALAHNLTLLTPDPLVRQYAVPTLW
jgi:PIN domain nuclease of toxin-antitoxin system